MGGSLALITPHIKARNSGKVFGSQNSGVGRDLQITVLLKNERSFSGGDNHSHDIGGGDTQTLLTVKKVKLYALIVSGDVRTSGASPCTHYEPPGETCIIF